MKSILIWLATIITFVGIIYLKRQDNNWSNIEYGLLIIDTLLGIVTWAYMVSTFDKLFHKKYSSLKATLISTLFLLFTLVGGMAIILLFIFKLSGNSQQTPSAKISSYKLISSGLKIGSSGDDVRILQSALSKDKAIYPSGSISGYYGNLTQDAVINFQKKYSLNQSGELDELTTNKFNEVYGVETRSYYLQTPTSVPVNNNSLIINNQNNIDPLVNCNVNANCGGGTRQLKQSVCSQSTCCQVGNSWLFYESKDKCNQDQNSYQNNNRVNNTIPTSQQVQNKVPVFLTYGGYTTYCPSQNVSAVQSIDSTMNSKKTEWAKNYNDCADAYYKSDSCYVGCSNSYTGSDEYSTCISKCTPPSSSACDYVYYERKSLTSQILDLCK